MHSLVINIENNSLLKKVLWFLEHLKKDGLEITSQEDFEDIRLMNEAKGEETIPLEDYLKNESCN